MRLINTQTLNLSEFFGSDIPRYAILSHTWEKNGEITYQEWIARERISVTHKSGYQKIIEACHKAKSHRIEWLWMDTNCIDKTSSAELSEAINSMFTWYHDSVECYVYMADVNNQGDIDEGFQTSFRQSKWFTRGWTLQELLAPIGVLFFSRNWTFLGSKNDDRLQYPIIEITGIDASALSSVNRMSEASVAAKMSWLSRRDTTRVEDMAYCMLGIFGLNMPLLYGEGPNAFIRLQEEIIKTSNDQSIFAWSWNEDVPHGWTSVLAPSPSTFIRAAKVIPSMSASMNSYSITNAGLSIRLPLAQALRNYWAVLDVVSDATRSRSACIPLARESSLIAESFQRVSEPRDPLFVRVGSSYERRNILIKSRRSRLSTGIATESVPKPVPDYLFGALLLFPMSVVINLNPPWLTTIPSDALDDLGILRFGISKLNQHEVLSSVLVKIRDIHICIVVPGLKSQQKKDHATDTRWYIKSWTAEHETIYANKEDIDQMIRDVQRIEADGLDYEMSKGRYGISAVYGRNIWVSNTIESRIIMLGEDLQHRP